MNEHDWLATVHVGSMIRHLTHEVHEAIGEAIGDHPRAQPLISQRKLKLFDDACFALFGLNLDDVVSQENPVAGAADCLRDIVGNPWRPVTLCGFERKPFHNQFAHVDKNGSFWLERECPRCRDMRTSQVLTLATAAYAERPGRECAVCKGRGEQDVKNYHGAWETWGCDTCHGIGRIEDGTLDLLTLAAVADALEEAGCSTASGRTRSQVVAARKNAVMGGCCDRFANNMACDCLTKAELDGILEHLRSSGPHTRGCWVVDLILGKE